MNKIFKFFELNLGENIKAYRKERNWKPSQLSEALDIGVGNVYNWEAGTSTPNIEMMIKLSEAFDITLDQLILGEKAHKARFTNRLSMSSKKDQYEVDFVQLNTVNEPFLDYSQDDFNNLNLLVPVQAQAGYAIEEPSVQAHECSPVSIPGIRGRARTVEVSGSSMEPVLYAGDWVVCTPVSEVSAIQDGAVHVVVSASNGVLIKYLKTDQSGLVCTSESGLLFPPVVIPYAEVREVWQARLVITSVPLGHNSMPARFARLEAFIAQQFPQFGQDSNNV